MIRRPPRSTLFPTRRSSDLAAQVLDPGVALVPVIDVDLWRPGGGAHRRGGTRSGGHTSELPSPAYLLCRLLPAKTKAFATSQPADLLLHLYRAACHDPATSP